MSKNVHEGIEYRVLKWESYETWKYILRPKRGWKRKPHEDKLNGYGKSRCAVGGDTINIVIDIITWLAVEDKPKVQIIYLKVYIVKCPTMAYAKINQVFPNFLLLQNYIQAFHKQAGSSILFEMMIYKKINRNRCKPWTSLQVHWSPDSTNEKGTTRERATRRFDYHLFGFAIH